MASFGSNSSKEEEAKRIFEQKFPSLPSELERLYPEVKLGLAPGYRFSLSDDQLIMDYLMNKIMGYKLPADIINEIDLYAYDPPLLLPMSEFNYGKDNEAYFFTLIPQTYRTTEPIEERTINGGYWRATGETEQIYHYNEIVGFKRIFVFYQGQAPIVKETSWLMHEFSVNPRLVLDDEPSIRTKIQGYELCRIIDKDRSERED